MKENVAWGEALEQTNKAHLQFSTNSLITQLHAITEAAHSHIAQRPHSPREVIHHYLIALRVGSSRQNEEEGQGSRAIQMELLSSPHPSHPPRLIPFRLKIQTRWIESSAHQICS